MRLQSTRRTEDRPAFATVAGPRRRETPHVAVLLTAERVEKDGAVDACDSGEPALPWPDKPLPVIDVKVVVLMLRNPALPAGLLERLARDPLYRLSDSVRCGLVKHPNTPPDLSTNLVKFLNWRDLVEVRNDSRLPQPLRMVAERFLGDHLGQLPVVEKVRLARTASRSVIKSLLRSRDISVRQELLRNPYLAERDVLPLVTDPEAPASLLELIARNPRWTARLAIRLALVENLSTPRLIARRLLLGLPAHWLPSLIRNIRLPAAVRETARKQLKTLRKRHKAIE